MADKMTAVELARIGEQHEKTRYYYHLPISNQV